MQSSSGKILITVGTTEFDQLIKYTDSPDFLSLIKECGFVENDITYQIGSTGKVIPTHSRYFRLSDNIQQIYDSHQIIFTHGGAGTLLACLKDPHKKIVAIANDTLSGNHQIELITKLQKQGYLLGFSNVDQLQNNREKVLNLISSKIKLRQFQPSQKSILNHLIFGKDL